MEENPAPRVPPKVIHLIVPQEQQELMDRRQYIASTYPRLAFPLPLITSQDEFALAKEYLELSMQHDGLLYKTMIMSVAQNMAPQLFTLSQQTLQEMELYQATLYGPHYQTFRSAEDDEELKKYYYDIHYRLAENQLVLLIPKVLTFGCRGDNPQINPHLQEIKRLEALISESPEHRKKLKAAVASAEETTPALFSLFHPRAAHSAPKPRKNPSRRMQAYKTAKYNENLVKTVAQGFPELQEDAPEHFDIHFELKMRGILTQNLELSTKKVSPTEYLDTMQKLLKELIGFEKSGVQFKAFISRSAILPQVEVLSVEELIDLYRFLSRRYILPQKDPLRLLEHSIFMCIQANNIEESLKRTEALSKLLPKHVLQSDHFKALRANVLALNGEFEEWRKLLATKRERVETIKSRQRQNKVQQITIQQAEHRKNKEQEAAQREEKKKKQERIADLKKEASLEKKQKIEESTSGLTEQIFSTEKEKYTPILPREKPKTRKPGSQFVTQETPSLAEQPSVSPLQLPKDYKISKPAFATYRKIREANWHFPRKDLCNLFEKLGCRINMEQGKGDHGTIHLPLTMTIQNTEGIVAVLPEFIQKEDSNVSVRPLTVPNWDEKWDGRVPPYMRKSILSALEYLGATDETVHK